MFDALFHLTDLQLFIIINCFFITISLLAVALLKWFFPKGLHSKANSILGNFSTLTGSILGVLAGLTALFLFNNLSYAGTAVQSEANAVGDLYRDSGWLQEPYRSAMRKDIKDYLDIVINKDWPQMTNGDVVSFQGEHLIDDMNATLKKFSDVNKSDLIVNTILQHIKSLYDAREQRINISYQSLSGETWMVILIVAILTLIINFFYNMRFYLHLGTVAALSLVLSALLFLLITLDRPFQGEFIIEPDSFQSVLKYIGDK